jgi:hypothetical protein
MATPSLDLALSGALQPIASRPGEGDLLDR